MRPDRDRDFEKNIYQLIQLIKKIISNPSNSNQWPKWQSMFKDQGLNLNLCFFNIFPMGDEDFNYIEELLEHSSGEEDLEDEDFSDELSSDDMEFLRKHGIRY